jgi:hypothetical protein
MPGNKLMGSLAATIFILLLYILISIVLFMLTHYVLCKIAEQEVLREMDARRPEL